MPFTEPNPISTMTKQEAEQLGYKVIQASPFEVGLVKNGKGVRTWWAKDFGGKLPGLDHSLILEHIRIQEELENEIKKNQTKSGTDPV